MKPENIKESQRRRRNSAIRSSVVFALLQIVSAVLFLWLSFLPELPGWCAVLFRVLAAPPVLMIVLIWKLLRERLREIEGGELDAAGEY